MSKVDAQRAMREAKYARIRASGPTRREAAAAEGSPAPAPSPQPVGATKSEAPAKTPAKTPAEAKTPPEAKTRAAEGERCGHKSMNGRVCTREAAHAEKSHRYG